jgi:Flp pilus assembly protein TadG
MAVVAPILVILMFGTIEMGLLYKDVLSLNNSALEGARYAALGNQTADVLARAKSAAPTMLAGTITATQEYRTYNASTSTWSAWTPLTNSGGYNIAPSGGQVRITLNYPHKLATGGLFASMATDKVNNTVTVKASVVMMRQ